MRQRDGATLPWTFIGDDGIALRGADGEVVFSEAGMRWTNAKGSGERTWKQIKEVGVVFPTARPYRRRLMQVGSYLSPSFLPPGMDATEIDVIERGSYTPTTLSVKQKDRRTFDWRLEYALDAALDVLEEVGSFEALGSPAFWRTVADDIAPSVPLRTFFFGRLLQGLDQSLGGLAGVRDIARAKLDLPD